MKIYTDQRLLRAGLVGGTLSRHGGNMRDLCLQAAALNKLGIDPTHILHFHQTHSDTIVPIRSVQAAHRQLSCPTLDADAWLFSPLLSGWGAAIVTADCVPLFVWDDTGSYATLAHCGWRGVVKGLAQKVVRSLLTEHPHLHLNAWLGPHIQSCCFEVKEDVASQFSPVSIIHRKDKIFVDLTTQIKQQLTEVGVPASRINAAPHCTCCDQTNFFSWRRDHEKNVLLSFLYKP